MAKQAKVVKKVKKHVWIWELDEPIVANPRSLLQSPRMTNQVITRQADPFQTFAVYALFPNGVISPVLLADGISHYHAIDNLLSVATSLEC